MLLGPFTQQKEIPRELQFLPALLVGAAGLSPMWLQIIIDTAEGSFDVLHALTRTSPEKLQIPNVPMKNMPVGCEVCMPLMSSSAGGIKRVGAGWRGRQTTSF